jgi:hypothetical protein
MTIDTAYLGKIFGDPASDRVTCISTLIQDGGHVGYRSLIYDDFGQN